MKNRTLHLAAATAAICLVALSCSKSKDRAGQSKASNSSEPEVELKVKWTPGKKITQRMAITATTEMGQSKNRQGQSIQQVTEMSWDYSINPLKELDQGAHQIELEFVATKMESRAGDRVYMSFDSAHDDGKETKDPFTPAFRKLVGGKLRYTIGADNKVQQVDGYDDFMVRIARGSKNSEMLKSMFSEDMLRRLCNWSEVLPDHAVRRGDSWKNSMEMNLYGMVKMVIDGKYTFKDWEDHEGHKCVKLGYTGTITGKGTSGAPFSIEKGKITGSAWFDPEQGLAVGSDSDQTMTINIQQRGNTMKQQVIQNVTMRLVE
jgi:hypothetical protein